MKMRFYLALFLFPLLGCMMSAASMKPRLLVTTDIGGDPDDQQSMIRLMVYANEFRIEGLIASSAGVPGELEVAVVNPQLIRKIVKAYGEVQVNLERHADGWPAASELRSKIKPGNPERGREAIGEGHDTEASAWIIERVDAGTPEDPLNISIWGGQTDLAQALWRVRAERGVEGLADFVRRFRVYDIMDQDGLCGWMQGEFPGMHYILSRAAAGEDMRLAIFRGMYLGGDEALTSREWVEEHVRSTGPLGALYPTKTWTSPNPHGCLKEGDTPSWFFFLPMGGNDPDDPTKPGWGGQFEKRGGLFRDAPPPSLGFSPRWHVWRWRPVYQEDFAKRMGWTKGS